MSLCRECSKNLLPKEEVKLKDNSVACNKCAYNILREHYADWYRKHPEKTIEEGPPEAERPISREFKFLEITCIRCQDSIAEYSKEDKVAVSEAVAYDKCQGKKCPDCGKIRQEIHIKMKVFKNGFIGSWINCPQCKKSVGYELNGVCWDCFWENESKKGCVCFNTRGKVWNYFCSLCKENHVLDFKCEKCIEKINTGSAMVELSWGEVKTQIPSSGGLVLPWKIVILLVVGGMVAGAIAGFVLGRVVWKKNNSDSKNVLNQKRKHK